MTDSANLTGVSGGGLSYEPGGTGTLVPPTTPPPEESDYMWVPFFVLGAVLCCLAIISFLHYHVQNRGRYQDKKYQAQNMDGTEVNRKYRVTLKSNGTPYSMGKDVSRAISQETLPGDTELTWHNHATLPPLPADGRDQSRRHDDVFVDPGVQAPPRIVRKLPDYPVYHDLMKNGKTSPETHCSYINEAFDSSCDSEKSLISSEMLKKQKRAEKYRAKSCLDTHSTDLEPEETTIGVREVQEIEKPRRKSPKPKLHKSSSRSPSRQTITPPIPGRNSDKLSTENSRLKSERKRSPPDSTSRVHPLVNGSRDSMESDLSHGGKT